MCEVLLTAYRSLASDVLVLFCREWDFGEAGMVYVFGGG